MVGCSTHWCDHSAGLQVYTCMLIAVGLCPLSARPSAVRAAGSGFWLTAQNPNSCPKPRNLNPNFLSTCRVPTHVPFHEQRRVSSAARTRLQMGDSPGRREHRCTRGAPAGAVHAVHAVHAVQDSELWGPQEENMVSVLEAKGSPCEPRSPACGPAYHCSMPASTSCSACCRWPHVVEWGREGNCLMTVACSWS